MTDQAIEVRDAHITYRVTTELPPTARERFGVRTRSRAVATVDAVRGVSFDVAVGEIVGLVGANGSGKSSLLRAIAGLQPLQQGSVLVRGEPVLLGVGAVLNKQLSGARNIILGCLALGMSRVQADERFDAIVEFAGIRHAIDRPMRTYSSGMKSRLAFAIASAVEPEILLVDEVLSVGDIAFRKRSIERLAELRSNARAVVFVSHSLGQVSDLCTRALWIDNGKLLMDGEPDAVIDRYKSERGAE